MKRFAIALCLVAAAAACSRNAPINRPQEQRDTVYTPRAAMLIHAYQPRRALAIIDSAVIVGNASPFLADFLRAKTYAESELDPGKDTTVSLCLALLQSDSTKTDTKAGIDNRGNVLGLLISIYRGKGDYSEWLKYSKELSDLEHAYGNETDALRMDAEVGLIMTSLGWREEGMEKLDNAINSLKGHKSLDKLDAFIVCTKRKIALLDSENDFVAIIPLAQSILSELDRYELDPGSYAEDSYRIPSNTNRQRWADWYRAQALCYAANAFAQKKPSDPDSTKYYINRCRRQELQRALACPTCRGSPGRLGRSDCRNRYGRSPYAGRHVVPRLRTRTALPRTSGKGEGPDGRRVQTYDEVLRTAGGPAGGDDEEPGHRHGRKL